MAAGNLITVTAKVSGDTLVIAENNIISMVGEDSNLDSRITYTTNNRTVGSVLLEDTVAALILLAPNLLPFTVAETGATIYINGSRIKESTAATFGSINDFDAEEAAWERLNFTETPAQVATAVNT